MTPNLPQLIPKRKVDHLFRADGTTTTIFLTSWLLEQLTHMISANQRHGAMAFELSSWLASQGQFANSWRRERESFVGGPGGLSVSFIQDEGINPYTDITLALLMASLWQLLPRSRRSKGTAFFSNQKQKTGSLQTNRRN